MLIPTTVLTSTGGSAGIQVIQEIVVPSGGSATVDFTSIPGTYRHLKVTALAQTENAVAQNFQLWLNNDSSSNYVHEFTLATSGSINSNTTSATFGHCGVLPATGATGPVGCEIWIPYYAQTTWQKLANTMWGYLGQQWGTTHFTWNSTAAITRLTFSSGGSSDIKEGSIFTLYGLA